MCRECRERFPRHRLQMKPLGSDPGMYHGTCVTHVSWCMPGLLPDGGGENVPGIPGACAARTFTYLTRDPWYMLTLLTLRGSASWARIHHYNLCHTERLWEVCWGNHGRGILFASEALRFLWQLNRVTSSGLYFIPRCLQQITFGDQGLTL